MPTNNTQRWRKNTWLVAGAIALGVVAYSVFGGRGESHPTVGPATLRMKTVPYVTVWPSKETCREG